MWTDYGKTFLYGDEGHTINSNSLRWIYASDGGREFRQGDRPQHEGGRAHARRPRPGHSRGGQPSRFDFPPVGFDFHTKGSVSSRDDFCFWHSFKEGLKWYRTVYFIPPTCSQSVIIKAYFKLVMGQVTSTDKIADSKFMAKMLLWPKQDSILFAQLITI